jgi:pyridoxal phosphate enzyme (YggS family)
MISLQEQYVKLKTELETSDVQLVAVSKTYPAERVLKLYDLGHRVFGENRVQELIAKKEVLPNDIQWHLIGHLQSNKVRQIVGAVDMVESVDSVKLLKLIQKEAAREELKVNILLQIRIAEEDTKYGFDPDTIIPKLIQADSDQMHAIRFRGVMGMASFVDDPVQIRREFDQLKNVFESLKGKVFQQDDAFDQISMGMSGDYKIAIEHGSTMVRIGSLLFGPRD